MVEVQRKKESPVKEEDSKESGKTKKEHKNLEPFFQPNDYIIKKGFKIHKRVGYGSFGQVFKGSRSDTGEYVAIKVEKMDKADFFKSNVLLHNEGRIMKDLQDVAPIPHIHYSNSNTEDDGTTYYFLVMDYMGLNLTELLYREIEKKFSPQTCLHLTTQIIRTLKSIHNKGVIHRDIKADNFLLGGSEASKNQVFLLDYGLATYYVDPQRKESHNPMREEKGVVGTGMFLSLNSHNMKTKSRRDDLEEVAYLFAYLWTGTLPWRNIEEEDNDKLFELIKKGKETASIDELFSGMPKEYKDFYTYTRSLEYEEAPDYDHYIQTFEDLMRRMNIDPKVLKMDWDPPDPQQELDLMISEMEQVIK